MQSKYDENTKLEAERAELRIDVAAIDTDNSAIYPSVQPVHVSDLSWLKRRINNRALFEARLAHQNTGGGKFFTVKGDVPVGFGYLWLDDAEIPEIRDHLPGVPRLMGLEIVEDHRNKGFGTKLISGMEKYATDAGRDRVALEILPHNDDAARLYERLGYHDWGHGSIYTYNLEENPHGESVRVWNELINVMVKNLEPTGAEPHDQPGPRS